MADEKSRPKEYLVGHGKPPVHTRFVKGRSGNPSGKRRRPRNFEAVILKILGEKVEIGEQGKRKRYSKLEVIAKQLVNRCVAGDRAWLQPLLPILLREIPKGGSGRPNTGETRPDSKLADQEAQQALARLTPKEQTQFFALLAKARGYPNTPVEEDESENSGSYAPGESPEKKEPKSK